MQNALDEATDPWGVKVLSSRPDQSHNIKSLAGKHFYGTENVIWAGFGPIGNTENNLTYLRSRTFRQDLGPKIGS